MATKGNTSTVVHGPQFDISNQAVSILSTLCLCYGFLNRFFELSVTKKESTHSTLKCYAVT
jgi:hypothetical protein